MDGLLMKIMEIRALRGPNYYSRYPVILMELDIGKLEDRPSSKVPDLADRLSTVIPSLKEHRCSRGYEGGFLERVREGTWAGHIVEHVSLELQCLANIEVGFGKTLDTDAKGIYNVVYRYRDEEVGIQAGRYAVEIVDMMFHGKRVDLKPMILYLKKIREANMFGPSTWSIIKEARKREIPHIRLNSESHVQLGHGVNQRRIQATIMDDTSAVGVEIADDKKWTKEILSQAGVPVPAGEEVGSLKEAYQAAEAIGYPVVVKPLVGHHGKGITTGVKNQKELKLAYASANRFHDFILVERHIEGFDHRVLVINGKFVASARRTPTPIIGDGKSTIRQLIDKINSDPDRGYGHEKVLTKIHVDYMTKRLLRQNNLTLNTILPKGKVLLLKSTANLSMGGISTDVTNDVHPVIRSMCERISIIIGLNVIGIDIIAPNLKKPLPQTRGGVVEVNAAPGFRMHLKPYKGTSRNVAEPIVDMLFPPGTEGTIPIIAVTGTNGKTTTVRLISHILKYCGCSVGTACTDGIMIENNMIVEGDFSGPDGAKFVLMEPTVDHAVLEVARGGIIRRGLGYDESDVGVLLNISGDHIGEGGITTIEELARLKGTIVETVKPSGSAVLNADDPMVMAFKDDIKARSILFSTNPENPALSEHVSNGGIAVTVDNGHIVIREEALESFVASVVDVPITLEGNATFNVSNALAATAAVYALGLNVEDIQAGLVSFNPTIGQLPGRMNLVDVGNIKVMIDYGHNVAAIEALTELIPYITKGRKIGVNHGTGSRPDDDIRDFGRALANLYDRIFLSDADPRRRSTDETPTLVREGALSTGFPKDKIDILKDERKATLAALEEAQDGDLVVIQACDVQQIINDVLEYKDKVTNV